MAVEPLHVDLRQRRVLEVGLLVGAPRGVGGRDIIIIIIIIIIIHTI